MLTVKDKDGIIFSQCLRNGGDQENFATERIHR